MKKVIIALLAVFMLTGMAQADVYDYWANVYRWDGSMNGDGTMALERVTSGITFKVLAVGADTAETLTYYGGTTSLTNPVTTANFASATVCDDKVAFRTDPTDSSDDTYVDLIVVDTAGGYTAFVEDFSPYDHSIVIDERPNIVHHGVIWFAPNNNSEADTGIDFDYDTRILNVSVEVVTIDATETLDVGLLSSETSGDANGLVAAASVAVATYLDACKPTITAGTAETYVSTASVVGALMGKSLAGANTATDEGSAYCWGHDIVGANAKSLTYTGSAGSNTAAGYIHYDFIRMR